jgi:penicillin-binding protein 2
VSSQRPATGGLDRTLLRLAIFGIVVVAMFVGLFSRLWFLQVLAADQYRDLAKENRVRLIHSEPPRGQILDRNGLVLVDNQLSAAVTIDKQILDSPRQRTRVLRNLSELLHIDIKELRTRLNDITVSPYKPVAVANDIPKKARYTIIENEEDFSGVDIAKLPIRTYPQGGLAAHIVGYVGEISEDNLKSDHFKGAKPAYAAGDIVGKAGLEYTYDRWLRGRPEVSKVVVNASGDVIESDLKQAGSTGQNLVVTLDAKIQALAEAALRSGVETGSAVGGAVVVLDPHDGAVRALASWPTYNPAILADGITNKEYASLGARTPENGDDDKLFDRAIQGERSPGSTFKAITAGAAMSTGVVGPFDRLDCPGSAVYPPTGVPGSVTFPNWTSTPFGFIDFAKSLEISCDTFYYELGWRMESQFGPSSSAGGDGTELFQKYMRTSGFDAPTGVDLPNEADGRVADVKWLQEWCKSNPCLTDQWLPGYTVNMAIGQGDLVVTPLQMASAYAAIANGGSVLRPHLAAQLLRDDGEGGLAVTKEFEPHVNAHLPLDATELAVIQQGLEDVISGADGTARSAFAGFPLDRYPLAGKTGTAQIGETANNDAWFVAYGPTDDPQYVIAVYVEKTFGHGGEIAAPVARQIFEGIFDLDKSTDVQLGQDNST